MLGPGVFAADKWWHFSELGTKSVLVTLYQRRLNLEEFLDLVLAPILGPSSQRRRRACVALAERTKAVNIEAGPATGRVVD